MKALLYSLTGLAAEHRDIQALSLTASARSGTTPGAVNQPNVEFVFPELILGGEMDLGHPADEQKRGEVWPGNQAGFGRPGSPDKRWNHIT
jgi:hypothetical protein